MLEKLKIKSLLDQFDYELDFSHGIDDRIRFLSGPNGYGKTSLLRIIDYLYHSRYDKLFSFHFHSLEMWVDGAYLKIEKEMAEVDTDESSDEEAEPEVSAMKYTYVSREEEFTYTLKQGEKMSEFDAPFTVHLRSLPCYFIPDKVIVSQNNEEDVSPKGIFGLDDESVVTSVAECATGLATKMQERMLVLPSINTEKEGVIISEEEYNGRLLMLSSTLRQLENYSMIGNGKVTMFKPEFAPYLRLYIEQLEDSVKQVENFLKRLQLFETIISELEFTNKEILINSISGFFFRLTVSGARFIENEKLSSGEQHVIIQLYNMLFCKAGDYMLTLIDEPELSLHPAWIALYYKHLSKIVELRNMQCILATHSADIFSMQWDKCIDLYDLMNE